ncbi:Derlin-2/3 [Chaetoceros tenuissimus]|uniref:Derlin n=1 Tax=Chaetoceros tenuissimus TaxID=426638 RepID=A0AAD3D931_9STRA|nr:Derlin-2/3 [Chaetoceros tenuissimus]
MVARGLGDVGPESWYNSIPFVTKNWLTLVLVTTVSINLGVLPGGKMVYDFSAIAQKFEIWRLFTCFLWMGGFGKQDGFQTVIGFFLLYQYSKQYEGGVAFNTGGGGGTADYVFMLLFGMMGIMLSSPFLGTGPMFCKCLIYYVLYIWSKRNPTAPANIWGVPMQGMYLPFVLLGLNFILGNNYMEFVSGYAAGHLYYFLVDVVPKVYGTTYLQTPLFIINQFGIGDYVPPTPVNGMGAAGNNTFRQPGRVNAPAQPAATTGGHNWGSGGQRLGRD